MCVDGDGKLVVIEKVKTKKVSWKPLFPRMASTGGRRQEIYRKCFISHADSEKEASKTCACLRPVSNLKGNVEVKEIGHIIGHTLSGTVAVFFAGDKR